MLNTGDFECEMKSAAGSLRAAKGEDDSVAAPAERLRGARPSEWPCSAGGAPAQGGTEALPQVHTQPPAELGFEAVQSKPEFLDAHCSFALLPTVAKQNKST